MSSHNYRVIVTVPGADEIEVSEPAPERWTSAAAVAYAHGARFPGTAIRIERQVRGTVGRSGCRHPWLPHRSYIVSPDGIVRRTDRSPTPKESPK